MQLQKNLHQLQTHIFEILLICGVVFYWGSTSLFLNPIAISLIAFLIFQMIYKNKFLGTLLSLIIIALSLFMFLALFSEVLEVMEANQSPWELIIVGSLLFGLTSVLGFGMLLKNIKPTNPIRLI